MLICCLRRISLTTEIILCVQECSLWWVLHESSEGSRLVVGAEWTRRRKRARVLSGRDMFERQESGAVAHTPSSSVSLSWKSCLVDLSFGAGYPYSFSLQFYQLVISAVKNRLVCWEVGATLICGYKDKVLGIQLATNWFRKMAMVCFPLGSMTSPATGLQHQTWIPSYWAGLQSKQRSVSYPSTHGFTADTLPG